ncbi:MAG: MATE family efflux transporter [Clostridia bacterium]|nr:MATE family efflux transporter [Clostridia bacterium]
MAKSSTYSMDMCSGSVLKKMLIFAVPLMLSGMLQLLFNAADVIVVGRFAGADSLAAVGSTTALINLMTNLFIGLSIGANVMAARYFGAGQERELKETVHTSMTLSAVCGVVLTVVGIVFAPTILRWMGTPDGVEELAALYLQTYFIGMTATMVYNFGAAVLRAVGDTKRPLYFLLAAGVINVSLNLLFVIVFGWGVVGVGIATAVSQIVSAVCVVVCLLREKSAVRMEWKSLGIKKDKLLKIIKIGLPAGLQSCLFSLANVVIQSSINSFGTIVVAGNSASQNLEGFMFVAMNSFHQAAISFTSQNVGAARYERLNRIWYTSLICVIVSAVVIGSMMLLFGEPLLGLYVDEQDAAAIIRAGMDRLAIMATAFAIAGVMDVTVGVLRGLGCSVVPMIVSLVGVCALRLVWIMTVFQLPAFHKIEILYITYPISWAITFVAQAVCLLVIRKRLNRQWGYHPKKKA